MGLSEADIDQDLPEQPTPAPEASPEAPKTPAVKPEPAKEVSLRDQIKTSIEKVNTAAAEKAKPVVPAADVPADGRVRGPDGKFLPKDAAPAKAVEQPKVDVKPQPGAQPGAEQPKKADAAPGTWKAEAKSAWAQIPDHAKAEILRRESESTREVTKYQQQIQQINQAYGPIEAIIGPRRHLWRATFGSEGEAIKRLTDLSDFASQDPTGFLQYYLNQPDVAGKVDLQKIFGEQAGGGASQPLVQNLTQEIAGLKQQLSGLLNQHQTTQQRTVEQEIAQFATETDGQGNPLRPHFEVLREKIFHAIPELKAVNPNLTPKQILEKAYRAAVLDDEQLSAEAQRQTEAKIRERIEKEQRAAKAQLANKSIQPGAPPSNGQAGPAHSSDLRGELVRNFAAFARGDTARI